MFWGGGGGLGTTLSGGVIHIWCSREFFTEAVA